MKNHWINFGFTLENSDNASDKSDANAILVDPLFRSAKNNDAQSAQKLWQREWDRNPQGNLKKLLDAASDSQDIVFITVPGTSRRNRIPLAAAEFMTNQLGDRARFINGDRAFMPIHTSMMKSISRQERVFHPRVFETHHSVIRAIHESCPQGRFFVVEDLLTTGNSAHSFQRFLEKRGIPISGVIAMKGEYEPNVHPNLTKKISDFFKRNNISLDAEKLSQELTGKEAQTIAFQISSLYKNADEKHKQLFRDLLQGLYEIRVNGRNDFLPQMDELGKSLTLYLIEKTKEDKNAKTTNSNNMEASRRGVPGALEPQENSTRKLSGSNSSGTQTIGAPTPNGQLRDDRVNQECAGTDSTTTRCARLKAISKQGR